METSTEFKHTLKAELDARGWDTPELRVEMRKRGCDVGERAIETWLSGEFYPQYRALVALGEIFGGIERFFPETCKAAAE